MNKGISIFRSKKVLVPWHDMPFIYLVQFSTIFTNGDCDSTSDSAMNLHASGWKCMTALYEICQINFFESFNDGFSILARKPL